MGDEELTQLLNMGFGYEESTAALESCKNNVAEAVAYLTEKAVAVVPYGPDNKNETAMEVETFDDTEEFPKQGTY